MSFHKFDDQQLIAAYLEGNHPAFEALLMRHKRKIYQVIYMRVKDREVSDDLFQDTFIKIIQTLQVGNYNEEGKFLPWATRIAHNLVIDYFRRQNKMKMVSERPGAKEDFNIFSVLTNGDSNTLQNMCHAELLDQMVQLVEFLPEPQKEMIHMRIFQDLSFKEIAENEGISINTALGRMRYALLNMRKMIEKHQLVVDLA